MGSFELPTTLGSMLTSVVADFERLIEVFEQVKVLVGRPQNNFAHSGWEDSAEATEEIEQVISVLRGSENPQVGSYLFLPTGPICELAVSSGLGDEYCLLANRYDEAVSACQCSTPGTVRLTLTKELGLDAFLGDVSVHRCPRCHQMWLRYALEDEAFSGSGRWYLGVVSTEDSETLNAAEARNLLESLDWYFCGGSYFGGQVSRTQGPLT